MGFSFRRSASFGPFRLNFSKSGVGASIGVKGTRLTMTPRGTTYITVSSYGFRYRETIFSPGPIGASPSRQHVAGTSPLEGKIDTANALEFVDSSNATLIKRLNERAGMLNPAWFLYLLGAGLLIWGLTLVVNGANALQLPALPDVTTPLSAARKVNETDEYSLLLARYGQPNMVAITSLQSVPLRTAIYDSIHMSVVFVPNRCVDAYEFYESHKESANANSASPNVRHSRPRRPKSAEKAPVCVPPPDNGSTIVRYQDAEAGSSISAESAWRLLGTISSKSFSQPTLVRGTDSITGRDASRNNPQLTSEALPIRFNQETVREEEQLLQEMKSARQRDRKNKFSLLLGGIGLLVGGGFLHRHNSRRRTTRLIYELNETARQNQNVLEQSLKHLARCHMIWRVVAESPTYDWKRNAGAGYLLQRMRAAVHTSAPPCVESNVAVG